MPISNKSGENHMTTTTIRADPAETRRRQQAQDVQIKRIPLNNSYQSQTTNNQSKTTESYPYKTQAFANNTATTNVSL